jgi:UDP-galactopyranose mutase
MIPILGAGLAGLSAAYHLNGPHMILEKDPRVGGLCKSVNISGYVFDYAPHILFTRDDYVMTLFEGLLKGNLYRHTRRSYIYLKDAYVRYPFEANLNALPEDIIQECIDGVMNRETTEPTNFEEWIYATFGDGIAKHYMIPYNRKTWKYDLSKMNIDWIRGRVPSPSVEEMKKGAAGTLRKDYGPNAEFMYPKHGGIGALANRLSEGLNVSPDSEVVEVKPSATEVRVKYRKEGEIKETASEKAISSIPLPELIRILHDPPEEVIKAAAALAYNSLICVNIGVKRPDIIDKHWLYFPEEKFIPRQLPHELLRAHHTRRQEQHPGRGDPQGGQRRPGENPRPGRRGPEEDRDNHRKRRDRGVRHISLRVRLRDLRPRSQEERGNHPRLPGEQQRHTHRQVRGMGILQYG